MFKLKFSTSDNFSKFHEILWDRLDYLIFRFFTKSKREKLTLILDDFLVLHFDVLVANMTYPSKMFGPRDLNFKELVKDSFNDNMFITSYNNIFKTGTKQINNIENTEKILDALSTLLSSLIYFKLRYNERIYINKFKLQCLSEYKREQRNLKINQII